MAQGIPAPLARQLARKTVIGSGRAAGPPQQEESAALRQAVTSPNGVTERALAVLMRETAWPWMQSGPPFARQPHGRAKLAG